MDIQSKYPSDIFDQFFNNSIDLLCIADTQGYFQKLNAEWERTLGYSLKDLEGRQFLEFVHPEDVESTIEATSRLANNEKVIGFINRYMHKNGSFRWIEWRSFPSSGMIYASARDITNHIETEKQLRNSEEKFSLAFKTIPDAISITLLSDGKFLDISHVYTEVTGFTLEDVVGKTSLDLNIWVNSKDRDCLTKGLIEFGMVKNMEAKFRSKDGRILDCLMSASLVTIENEKCVLAITKDITEMNRANAALKESESILKATTEAIGDGLIVVKSDGGVSHYNEKVLELFGREIPVASGKTAVPLYIVSKWVRNPVEYAKRINQILSDRHASFDVLELNDGRIIEQLSYPLKIEGDSLPGRVWVYRDKTEQRKQEELIRENQELFKMAFENAPTGMSIVNPEGKFIAVNPKLCEMFGYSADDLLNGERQNSLKFTHPDDIEPSLAWIKKIVAGDLSEPEFEKRYIHKDGHIVWGLVRAKWLRNDNGSLKLAVNHVMDITKRKEADQEVVRSRELLAQAQRIAHIGSFEIDLLNQTGYFSKELYELLNIDPQDKFPNQNEFLELIHPEDREKIRDNSNPNDIPNRVATFEYRTNPALGPVKHFLSKSEFMVDAISKKPKIVGYVQDITAQKMAEDAIKNLNSELELKVEERTQKLNEAIKDLEAFAYSVSHDLRAPVRHIDGFIKLMYGKIEEPAEAVTNYYNKVKGATSRMSTMIDSLLAFSRMGRKEITFSLINTNALLNEIVENLKPDIGNRNIRWIIPELPLIYADKNMIKLVFENLLSNAVKYTSTKNRAEIEIGFSDKAESIELFVKDNGIGFDMNYSGKLFGVFQRLHNSEDFEGVGIGLANVKQIIEKHNGSVHAEGKLNEGTVIHIQLPKTKGYV